MPTGLTDRSIYVLCCALRLRNPTPPDNRTSTVLVILFANNGLGTLTDGTVLALDRQALSSTRTSMVLLASSLRPELPRMSSWSPSSLALTGIDRTGRQAGGGRWQGPVGSDRAPWEQASALHISRPCSLRRRESWLLTRQDGNTPTTSSSQLPSRTRIRQPRGGMPAGPVAVAIACLDRQ